MIGAVSGLSPYAYSRIGDFGRVRGALDPLRTQKARDAQPAAAVTTARKSAAPEVPVQPVRSVTSVPGNAEDGLGIGLRQGADPVEMAVRMRIQYVNDPAEAQEAAIPANAPEAAAQSAVSGATQNAALGAATKALDDAENGVKGISDGTEEPVGAESVQKTVEEAQCQTCKERKYQDGSDDSGVSFQTPTHIDPDMAPAAVRGHEQEHVVREQAKAGREDRKVLSQSVSIHTDICPECGRVYVSGGTTRTTTAAVKEPEQAEPSQQENKNRPAAFSAVA